MGRRGLDMPVDSFPELKGTRVSIRPVTYNDLPTLCRWWNDPVVMREVHAEDLKPTLEQVRKDAWPVWQNPGPDDYHEFVICQGETLIGEIGFRYWSPDRLIVSVDIKIGESSLWGQGLGTEAMSLFVGYLFEVLNARQVIARPGDWNRRSRRLFEKCGFREINREEIPATGNYGVSLMVTLQRDRE